MPDLSQQGYIVADRDSCRCMAQLFCICANFAENLLKCSYAMSNVENVLLRHFAIDNYLLSFALDTACIHAIQCASAQAA